MLGSALQGPCRSRRRRSAILEVIEHRHRISNCARGWPSRARAVIERAAAASRRPHGGGLGGIESLDEAVRPLRRVGDGGVSAPAEIMRATRYAAPRGANRQTRAVHAAAFWRAEAGIGRRARRRRPADRADELAGSRTAWHEWTTAWCRSPQPCIGGNGAENRCNRRSVYRRHFRANLGASWCAPPRRRDHAGRGGARRRLRDVHRQPPHQRTRSRNR